MTNKGFYGDKLLAVVLKGNCDALYRMVHGESCMGLFCGDCEFGITKESEIENVLQWLNAEHEEPEPPLLENGDGSQLDDWIMVRDKNSEPPLLENGDGLKSGDLIMVRDFGHQSWVKRPFAYFYGERFYCALNERNLEDGMLVTWQQARLPMEGE